MINLYGKRINVDIEKFKLMSFFSNLGNEGVKLIRLYKDKLQITLGEASSIIMKNKTAQAFIKEELALSVTGEKRNLSALMSITLLRRFYDFEPLRETERELIKKYYDLEIGTKNNILINLRLEKMLSNNLVKSNKRIKNQRSASKFSSQRVDFSPIVNTQFSSYCKVTNGYPKQLVRVSSLGKGKVVCVISNSLNVGIIPQKTSNKLKSFNKGKLKNKTIARR